MTQRPKLWIMPSRVDETPRYYVIVRQDLSIAVQMVQVAHACLTAGSRFTLPPYHHLVFLGVGGERELVEAHEFLLENAIANICFYEPDDEVGYTAICTEPLIGERRRALKRYNLWSSPSDSSARIVG